MAINEPLNLLIYDQGQESFLSCRRKQVIDGESLMLSSKLLKYLGQMITNVLDKGISPNLDEIETALRSFYQEVNGSPEIIDEPVLFSGFDLNYQQFIKSFHSKPDELGMLLYFAEAVALYAIIRFWFDPGEASSSEMDTKHWLQTSDHYFLFKHRCRQYHSFPFFSNQRFSYAYGSPGILPLCWAEMLHGTQNNIKAGICPYCHTVYLYPYNNFSIATCDSVKCKKAYMIDKTWRDVDLREET